MIRLLNTILGGIPAWVWSLAIALQAAAWGLTALESRALEHKLAVAEQRVQYVTAAKDAEIQAMLAAAAEQRAKDEAAARAREQALAEHYGELERAKDEQITRLRADVRSIRYGLRDLPARPAFGLAVPGGSQGVAAAAGQAPAVGCAGPVLYREDGGLLVQEAERADTIRLELLKLYDLLDRARAVK